MRMEFRLGIKAPASCYPKVPNIEKSPSYRLVNSHRLGALVERTG
jgi:hypothetical protein